MLACGATNKKILQKITRLHNRYIRLMCLHGNLYELNFSVKELIKNLNLLITEDIYTN